MLFLTSGYYPLFILLSTHIEYLEAICFASWWKKNEKRKKEGGSEKRSVNAKQGEKKSNISLALSSQRKRDSKNYTSGNFENISLKNTVRVENLNLLLAAVKNLFSLPVHPRLISSLTADYCFNFDTDFFTHYLCAWLSPHLKTIKLSTFKRTHKFNQASFSSNWSSTFIHRLGTTEIQSIKQPWIYISIGQF